MNQAQEHHSSHRLIFLTLAALGVVYGDIGTSPLYAVKECFVPGHGVFPSKENVLGVISLIIWALTLIVSVKYLLFVLRADNKGEGGVLALMALAQRALANASRRTKFVVMLLGLCGAALLYGDGAITPAISVLSAVEGLAVATPAFERYITFIAVVILFFLFLVQRGGTSKLGAFFGPVILLWFVTLAGLGLYSLIQNPEILQAISPHHAVRFLIHEGAHGFYTLGAVFLATTGAEALYADMGHFGRQPIRLGWFSIAFPALLLNYLGQGALLLRAPETADHPFFELAPSWALYPLVGLATLATVIASQALISGAFSLTSQAIQLGYFPRVQILHTSWTEYGQIYIPLVNWSLLCATLALVLIFKTSNNLASAYGIAVATTMVITSSLVFFVARYRWKWSKLLTFLVIGAFLTVDSGFLVANSMKFFQGGWVPILMGLFVFTIMLTWWEGRNLLWSHLQEQLPPFSKFFSELRTTDYYRVDGAAVFMIRDLEVTPPALIYNLRHNRVIHERVILLSVVTDQYPHISPDQPRVEVKVLGRGFYRLIIHYGFMENPDVPYALRQCCENELHIDLKDVVFFLDRVLPVPTPRPGMALWREHLFTFMAQNSLRATKFYKIPTRQVIEIGFQIEF